MTAKLVAVLLVLAAIYGGYYLFNYYRNVEQQQANAQPVAPVDPSAAPAPPADPNIPSDSLAGLPQRMEPALKAAYAQGVTGLGNWLKTNARYVADPRLAAIQLDYAALLSRTDPEAAKKIFATVRARTPANSPIYARLKKVEPLYQ